MPTANRFARLLSRIFIFALPFCALSLPALQISDLTVFSDRDEKGDSTSTVSLSLDEGEITARFSIPEHPSLGYSYGGFSLRLELVPGARSLAFELKRGDGAPMPKQIALRTKSGKRLKLDLAPYAVPEGEWAPIRIALSDFAASQADLAQLASMSLTLASHSTRDDISLLAGTVRLRRCALSPDEAPSRLALPEYASLRSKKMRPGSGHGAWIYETSPHHVARILHYNQTHPTPIRHLFVYGGSIAFAEGGKATLTALNLERLDWFQSRLPGVRIWANVDASDAQRLGAMPWEAQERLAKQLAEAAASLHSNIGLHVDIEPYDRSQLPFYIYLKRFTDKPVSASFGIWDSIVLQVVDFPVLMGYDLAKTPAAYGIAAEKLIRPFLDDCATAASLGLVGLPFAAASVEYEWREHRKNGAREDTGFLMEDFLNAVLPLFAKPLNLHGHPGFGGISIWAFPTEGRKGIGPPRSEWGHYPNVLKESCLDLLEKF